MATQAGWLAATSALVALLFGLGIHVNFFFWAPKWDAETMMYLIGIVAVLICIWFLAKVTKDGVTQLGSLLLCLILLGFVFLCLPPEPLGPPGVPLSRRRPSPLWYRAAQSYLLGLPLVFWLLHFWLHSRKEKRN